MSRTITTSFKNSCSISILAFAMCAAVPASAGRLPGHGQYVAGQGSISKSGRVLTIDQNSRAGIINWRSFSIGKKNSVEFDNAGGATLNRVTGGGISKIAGQLHGAGSVYLINNNGVAILPTGKIVTQGSFAASGSDADSDAFLGGRKRLIFTGGARGDVVNAGQITSVNGRVDLYGRNVTDSGSIAARNASVIAAGSARVSGKIAATAVKGRGGNIETSGNRVNFAHATIRGKSWLVDPKNLKVTASAASTISSSLNSGTNVTLKTTATSASGPGTVSNGPGDISIVAPITWNTTAALKLNAYHGVNIADVLHIAGQGELDVATHNGGVLLFGTGGKATFDNLHATLVIDGNPYRLVNSIANLASHVAANPSGNFALANNIDATALGTFAASPVPTTLTGNFEGLGHTISNLTIKSPHAEAGLFNQVGTGTTGSLSNLTLKNVDVRGTKDSANVGALVGFADNPSGAIWGIRVGGNVAGQNSAEVGGIVGLDYGPISSSASSAAVTGKSEAYVGGIMGGGDNANANLTDVTASGSVTDNFYDAEVGGLAGYSYGSIDSSSATGDISAKGYVSYSGGLVGYFDGDHIKKSFATGNVAGGSDDYAGGLGGYVQANVVANVHATGNVTSGDEESVGGLIGYADVSTIVNTYATGDIIGGAESDVGGLIGDNEGGTVSKSHATGSVLAAGGESYVGGLMGYNDGGDVANTYATGDVTAPGSDNEVGGLIGDTEYATRDSYATGNVVGGGYESYTGGLLGYAAGAVTSSHATGSVKGGGYESYTAGLVGEAYSTTDSSYATGNVKGGGYDSYTGGLDGYNEYGISKSHASGNVSGGGYESYVGGLTGYSDDDVTLSRATGNVTGSTDDYESSIGGLIGYQESGYNVHKSYATGNVVDNGDEGYVGGLIGENIGATVSGSYATGAVTSNTSYPYVGGLVGYNEGSITNSHATGAVSLSGAVAPSGYDGYAGGLLGYNDATVTGSWATGNLNVNSLYTYAGGLIGENSGTVSKSYAKGNVVGGNRANDGYFGGLIGDNSGPVTQSYATGDVSGGQDSYIGGLIGYSNGTLAEVYARGDVTGRDESDIGGLVGYLDSTLDQGYSTGAVSVSDGSTTSDIGGLIGYDNSGGGITNSYWDRTTSGITSMDQGAGNIANDIGITGQTTAQLKALPAGLSATYWKVLAGKNNGFPYLKGVAGQ